MGERKVLNKYYPPDFDPSIIPKRKRPKNEQIKVRMMLPMSVRCLTCGEYLYKGKKFNARKETVVEEEYLGIKIFRFYLKCTRCSAEFTIKTDPKNSDYACEFGASRNFEPWRERDKAIEEAKQKREEEEEGDTMKALENRTVDSKIEMDILDALDEIKSMNARNAKVDLDSLLVQKLKENEEQQKRLSEEDEAEIQSIVFRNSENFVRRLEDDEEDDNLFNKPFKQPILAPPKQPNTKPPAPTTTTTKTPTKKTIPLGLGIICVKTKKTKNRTRKRQQQRQ
jgi:DNA-directed RNA polymerase subunit RPC12/RpoP